MESEQEGDGIDKNKLTGPERWLYERLNPFRVKVLTWALYVLLVVSFSWAAYEFVQLQLETQHYIELLKEHGCRRVPEAHRFCPDLNMTGQEVNTSGLDFEPPG